MEKGFVIIPKQITRDPTLSNGAYRVYGVLRSFADSNAANSFPARETVARQMGQSLSSVKIYLKELKMKGYVGWKSGFKSRSNAYSFPLDRGSRMNPPRLINEPHTGSQTSHHQESSNKNYNREHDEKLTYGKDNCFVTDDGKIILYDSISKERKTYSDGDDKPFKLGNLHGSDARREAMRRFMKP